jgi:hypothetical protein
MAKAVKGEASDAGKGPETSEPDDASPSKQ